MRKIYIICVGLLLAGCSADDNIISQPKQRGLHLTTSVNYFEEEDNNSPLYRRGGVGEATRTNVDGNAFALNDKIKLKIICPYTPASHTNIGETTYGNTFDALWLMKWTGSDWAMITAEDKVDVGAGYRYSGAYNLFGQYEAQQTPYVYTASTWNENVLFLANGSLQSQYSYIFHADQTLETDYLKSDLLWAQTYMQTGSYDVHLSFNHVMACLKIDISDLGLSTNAVVTLEGMPDIDQREVVVGDYYAEKSKVNSKYGYKDKCTCTKENNGKVLGVAVIDENQQKAVVYPMTGNPNPENRTPIANTGVYTAHKIAGYYYIIVPPCTLTAHATIWVRDGENRYTYAIDRLTFEQGKLYPVTVALPIPTPTNDPDTEPESEP